MDSKTKQIYLSASEARGISACSKIDIEDEERQATAAFAVFQRTYPIAGMDYRKDVDYLKPMFTQYGSCKSLAGALEIVKTCCERGETSAHPNIYDEELMRSVTVDLTRLDYRAVKCGNECTQLHINWAEETDEKK